MINQAAIVRYTATVCEIFFSDFRKKTFSAESEYYMTEVHRVTAIGVKAGGHESIRRLFNTRPAAAILDAVGAAEPVLEITPEH